MEAEPEVLTTDGADGHRYGGRGGKLKSGVTGSADSGESPSHSTSERWWRNRNPCAHAQGYVGGTRVIASELARRSGRGGNPSLVTSSATSGRRAQRSRPTFGRRTKRLRRSATLGVGARASSRPTRALTWLGAGGGGRGGGAGAPPRPGHPNTGARICAGWRRAGITSRG